MKKTEKILGIIFLLALILKAFNIPGNSMLIGLSVLLLGGLYFYLGFALFNDIPIKKIFKKESYSNKSKWRIIGTIGIGMMLSTMMVGYLYKLLHYPGSKGMLIIGLIGILIGLSIMVVKNIQGKNDFYKNMIVRTAIIGMFGLLLLVTTDLTIDKIQYRNHPEYLKSLEEYLENPSDKNIVIAFRVEKLRLTYEDEELNYHFNNGTGYLEEIMTQEEIVYYKENYIK